MNKLYQFHADKNAQQGNLEKHKILQNKPHDWQQDLIISPAQLMHNYIALTFIAALLRTACKYSEEKVEMPVECTVTSWVHCY